MTATGETIDGWRVFDQTVRRRAGWPPRWVEEPVYELVKGQRHIRSRGQDGIDPQIVLGSAVSAALADDLREAREARDDELAALIASRLVDHARRLDVRVNGWAASRVIEKAARLSVLPAGAGARGD